MTGPRPKSTRRLLTMGMLLAVGTSSAAVSQDDRDPEAANSYLQSLKACQAEPEPAARLACFDAAAASILSANETGELMVVDRQEVRQTKRKLFGFSLPDFGIFGKRGPASGSGQEDEESITELETTIAAVSGSHGTGYVLRTAEGAVWRIDDVPRRLLTPRVGDKLLIKEGALSSYFLRINDRGGVKGTRIR